MIKYFFSFYSDHMWKMRVLGFRNPARKLCKAVQPVRTSLSQRHSFSNYGVYTLDIHFYIVSLLSMVLRRMVLPSPCHVQRRIFERSSLFWVSLKRSYYMYVMQRIAMQHFLSAVPFASVFPVTCIIMSSL